MIGSNTTHTSRFRTVQTFRFFVSPVIFAFLTLAGTVLGGCSGGNSGTTRAVNPPNLDACQNLQAPVGSKATFRVFASGVQIYRWSGSAWVFQAPRASLYTAAGQSSVVGTHYAGPTWEISGSKAVGAVLDRCTPSQTAIPWLLLNVTSTEGRGVFDRIARIQRVNTTGGLAPTAPGNTVGEVAEVPYTAEYYFYRASAGN